MLNTQLRPVQYYTCSKRCHFLMFLINDGFTQFMFVLISRKSCTDGRQKFQLANDSRSDRAYILYYNIKYIQLVQIL